MSGFDVILIGERTSSVEDEDVDRMCCICSGEPVEDVVGRHRTFKGQNKFQTTMLNAPCAGGCDTFNWFCGQFIPFTCCCTQYYLRKKVLNDDMGKYICCQGYFSCCWCKPGSCGEKYCPSCCLCLESCCCNSCAISSSRMYVIEKYDLSSDPCDYRLIRCHNALMVVTCICSVLSNFIKEISFCALALSYFSDIMYFCLSGCMTAQVAHEMNYQRLRQMNPAEADLSDVKLADAKLAASGIEM